MAQNTSNQWIDYQFGGAKNDQRRSAEDRQPPGRRRDRGGSIAAFPPPHNFFWAREIEFNLGYNWYRKDSDTTFSFGMRQAEGEEDAAWRATVPRTAARTSRYTARGPARGSAWRSIFYVSAERGAGALIQAALAYTRDDHYKPLPGYQVMATHFHTGHGPPA